MVRVFVSSAPLSAGGLGQVVMPGELASKKSASLKLPTQTTAADAVAALKPASAITDVARSRQSRVVLPKGNSFLSLVGLADPQKRRMEHCPPDGCQATG